MHQLLVTTAAKSQQLGSHEGGVDLLAATVLLKGSQRKGCISAATEVAREAFETIIVVPGTRSREPLHP